MSKSDLLEILDKEEEYEEEQIEIPKLGFDPVRKLASILEKSSEYMDFTRLKGSLEDNLIASYLVEHLGRDTTNSYLRRSDACIQKLIMADLASGITGNNEYEPSDELGRLSTKVAGAVYHDFFSVLYDSLYLKPKKQKKGAVKKQKKPKPAPNNMKEDVFLHFKGADLDALIAASNLIEYLQGVEERIAYCSHVSDVKYLVGALVYHNMIKNPRYKKDILKQAKDPEYLPKDVFVYSVLKFHQDFFTQLEKEGGIKNEG
ncbi:hypothetical protein AYK26_01400 [Euryarchaeota archaeon SM23-78]|nr:MAG: hypothetical protein AYK26_01400 [Euryarchaeota archaeon SM23-78]MBW3001255.1 hypothetical protein [Candidatus Woesearchaeota archaeon]